ncbi:PAS domain-containing protein [Dongia sp.]|uniref:PAS domain-containing protein n=1 Tax=Dongia sp. TaxID=1977262 RepID=UPI0037537585
MSGGAINHADGSEALPKSADLRRLLAYWAGRCGAREFPRRADIDPVDFLFMLDRITLTEVHAPEVGDERRYRLRLVGSYWYRLLGFEATGMWMHDFPRANQRKLTEDFYAALIDGRRPRFAERDAIVDDQLLHYEIMLLPLSEDGSRISMIMTAIGPN